MNPTERLRALLDERGVEWKEYGYENHTWWSGGENVGWHAENRPSVRGLYVKIEAVLTPEQAIAATLGRGECTFKWSLADNGWADYTCSECGFTENTDIHVSLGWKFCPNCGRTVVTA